MALRIPPPLVLFIFGILMYLLSVYLPVGYFDFFGRLYLASGLAIGALCLISVAWMQFFKAKTTVDPGKPHKAATLVTTGIFNYSRNPMYLGMLLILLSWGLWLGNAFNTLLAAGFVYYMNYFQIKPEEEALLHMFGKQFQRYCLDVRRWF